MLGFLKWFKTDRQIRSFRFNLLLISQQLTQSSLLKEHAHQEINSAWGHECVMRSVIERFGDIDKLPLELP